MSKESALKQVWDGDKLVGLLVSCESATSPSPTQFELEIVRIFNDRQSDTELASLKGFAHAVISDCWNFTLDAGEIKDLAEQLGLIVPHIITTDEAGDDYGVGDTMYQFSDILKENK